MVQTGSEKELPILLQLFLSKNIGENGSDTGNA